MRHSRHNRWWSEDYELDFDTVRSIDDLVKDFDELLESQPECIQQKVTRERETFYENKLTFDIHKLCKKHALSQSEIKQLNQLKQNVLKKEKQAELKKTQDEKREKLRQDKEKLKQQLQAQLLKEKKSKTKPVVTAAE
jgi:protein subunit release factor A